MLRGGDERSKEGYRDLISRMSEKRREGDKVVVVYGLKSLEVVAAEVPKDSQKLT